MVYTVLVVEYFTIWRYSLALHRIYLLAMFPGRLSCCSLFMQGRTTLRSERGELRKKTHHFFLLDNWRPNVLTFNDSWGTFPSIRPAVYLCSTRITQIPSSVLLSTERHWDEHCQLMYRICCVSLLKHHSCKTGTTKWAHSSSTERYWIQSDIDLFSFWMVDRWWRVAQPAVRALLVLHYPLSRCHLTMSKTWEQ